MRAWIGGALLIGLATAAASRVHAATWIEASDSKFQIFTDAGESAARELVVNLEQFDAAISQGHGWTPSSSIVPASAPTRIYLFRNEREFGEFRKESWSTGLTFAHSRSAPFVLIFWGPETRETAIHEYVHVLVQRGDWKLSHWFEEGLAEFYAHSHIAGRDRLSIGQTVAGKISLLQGMAMNSGVLDEPQSGSRAPYYAACWAMVHMILMDPAYRAQIDTLETAAPGDPNLLSAIRHLQSYVLRPVWKEETIAAQRPALGNLAISAISGDDAELMLAGVLLDAGRGDAAQKRYHKIASAHPNDATGAEAEGLAALAAGQTDDARRFLRRAIELGTTRARVFAELASLDNEVKVPWIQVEPLLERAAAVDPSDYRSSFQLGVREADDGRFEAAVAHLAVAARAAPNRPDVWQSYALALSHVNRSDDAIAAARRALRVANSPEWDRMASELLESLMAGEATAGTVVRRSAEVVTPPSWEGPKPDASIEGWFVEFICSASPRFRIAISDGTIIELKVTDPTRVNILNSPSGGLSIELRCGPQDGRPIRAEYRRSDSTVLGVEFPQVHDLPRF